MSVHRVITLNKGILTLCYSTGGECLYSGKATTGYPGCNDPRIRGEGPIPPGMYTLEPSEIVGGDFEGIARAYKRNRIDKHDWGLYWVELHPNEGTDVMAYDGLPREGFFMHGGVRPGSAGCIDVGTPYDVWLFNLIKRDPDAILVIVSDCPNADGW